jgi:hypothetical protein
MCHKYSVPVPRKPFLNGMPIPRYRDIVIELRLDAYHQIPACTLQSRIPHLRRSAYPAKVHFLAPKGVLRRVREFTISMLSCVFSPDGPKP